MDYSKARLLDPAWWRRFYILARGVGQEDDKELLAKAYDFHLALVANSGLTEDSFKQAQESARDTFYDLTGILRPWEGANAVERKKQEASGLREAYIQAFGDPKDPEVAARMQRSLERLKKATKAKREKETDLERVVRLQKERAARVEELKRQFRNRRFAYVNKQQGR